MSRDLCASLEKIGRKQPQPISLPRRYRGHRWPLPLSETGASPWLASSVRAQLKSLRRDRSPRTPWSRSSPVRSGSFRVSLRNTSSAGWENPLMGWTSTGDPYANVGDAGLAFDSEEAAKAFAEKHGWDYLVKKRHTPLMKVRAYADNFKWKAPPKAEAA